MLSLQRAGVQSLVEELRFCKPHSAAKKKGKPSLWGILSITCPLTQILVVTGTHDVHFSHGEVWTCPNHFLRWTHGQKYLELASVARKLPDVQYCCSLRKGRHCVAFWVSVNTTIGTKLTVRPCQVWDLSKAWTLQLRPPTNVSP